MSLPRATDAARNRGRRRLADHRVHLRSAPQRTTTRNLGSVGGGTCYAERRRDLHPRGSVRGLDRRRRAQYPGDSSSRPPKCSPRLPAVARMGFMAGNRDFLLGAEMLRACGVARLADPTLLSAWGGRVLLTHGDALCLADEPYQAFRHQVRSAAWRATFCANRWPCAKQLARQMRDASEARASARTGATSMGRCAGMDARRRQPGTGAWPYPPPGKRDPGTGLHAPCAQRLGLRCRTACAPRCCA